MLPALREELTLQPAAPAADGAPTWTLYDPVRNLFFQIDWLSFEILRRWRLGTPSKIASDVSALTTIDADSDDVECVLGFLHQNQLLQLGDARDTQRLLQVREETQQHWWHWLLHRYLFFRVPLWRPDRWLAARLPAVEVFYSKGFLLLSLFALAVSLVLVNREWSVFSATLVDFFKPSSLPLFLVTLAGVKLIHEFGHAFTARRFGCRVPTMGVAFLVLFPLAYTDVNEAWRLPKRRDRLLVGAAGILAELLLAIWATLAWFLVPDGLVRDALFLVATTTWISTLLVNLSPFLRFDGYFLLMDALELPNLHQRSFALARWQLRRWLFNDAEPVPEDFSQRRHALLVALAMLTWLYRLVVFTGIALLVYQLFPKPLGPLMAAVEMIWFIGRPLFTELRQWPGLLRAGWAETAGRRWVLVLLPLVLWLAFPWSSRIATQGLLQPADYLRISAPGDARVEFILEDGASVAAGERLLSLAAPQLESERRRADTRESVARWRAEVAVLDESLLAQSGVFRADSARSSAETRGFDGQLQRYSLSAEFSGRFFRPQQDLESGSWVGEADTLAVLADPSSWQVEAYVPESALARIAEGQAARFYPETAGVAPLDLTLALVEADASRRLSDPILSSAHGGQLLVRSTESALVPERALYRVILRVQNPADWLQGDPRVLRGRVVIFGEREAIAAGLWRSAAAVLVREAGL